MPTGSFKESDNDPDEDLQGNLHESYATEIHLRSYHEDAPKECP